MLTLEGVTKKFGGLVAVSGVDLQINKGRDPRACRTEWCRKNDPSEYYLRDIPA